jgi:formylmethanofuran dehydrogenase subunit A
MSKAKRTEEMATLNDQISKRTTLAGIDRELDWNEIVVMTRAAPAKVLGLRDKGHLGPGADADISIYDLLPGKVDPGKDYQLVKKALSRSLITIKSGQVVAKSGRILAVPEGRTYWVDASMSVPQADQERMMADLKDKFDRYYSVQMSNYMVQDAYIPHPMVIRPQPFDQLAEAKKEVA